MEAVSTAVSSDQMMDKWTGLKPPVHNVHQNWAFLDMRTRMEISTLYTLSIMATWLTLACLFFLSSCSTPGIRQ